MAASGVATWYDFVKAILSETGNPQPNVPGSYRQRMGARG